MQFLLLFILIFTISITKSFSNDNLININFKDLSIMELLKITSEKTNKSILITNDIEGKVDFISNGPIEIDKLLNILRFSLEDNGYKIIESNDILRVVKGSAEENRPTKIKKNTNKIVKKKSAFVSSKPLFQNVTEVIFLTNIESKSLQNILNTIISQRDYSNMVKPSIAIDELSNSIILDGKKDQVKKLKEIITKLDILKSQVYVKANIVEIDDNLLENVGLQFGILGGKVHSGGLSTFSSNLNGGNAIAIDMGSIGLQIPNVLSSLALGASLNLLNKTYALDIISQPSILCLNNKESSIYVGETVSIQTASTTTDGGTIKNSFEREDIGLTLKVRPRITENNKVVLEINTVLEGIKNINTLSLNPDTSKKEINTTAIVNNGESVIIGGLIENKNENTVEKIPYASDVPLIGELFKNRTHDHRNKNLVVIVTPYIIPKDKDLTYVRNELSKLKYLEDKFLEEVLINLKAKKENKDIIKVKNEDLKNNEAHKARIKKYFGI